MNTLVVNHPKVVASMYESAPINQNMTPKGKYFTIVHDLFRRLRERNFKGSYVLEAVEQHLFGRLFKLTFIDQRLEQIAAHFGTDGYQQALALIFAMADRLFGQQMVQTLYLVPATAPEVKADLGRIYSKIFL
ncbi:MAG: hypothetical protein RBJ76_13210 [Stenomitos frigidus ULC029]